MWALLVLIILSAVAFWFTNGLIPKLKDLFIKAGLYGIDLCKTGQGKVPEALGVVSGCVFLVTSFLFIPIAFGTGLMDREHFPHNEFAELLAALLSICCMLLLGFADDVLDLKWRYKLLLPTIASLPLLVVYYVNFNSTTFVVPIPLRHWFGTSIDIGCLYYVYMGMLAVFCTNAINILAGVNGLEAGQAALIAASVLLFNLLELAGAGAGAEQARAHTFSLYILLPYLATTLALLRHNWYPSSVFVGDTFCYVSGMTFAVVGILGHFSKTVLLFFLPQLVNFVYSLPQLVGLVPCPRHRLPRLDAASGRLAASRVPLERGAVRGLRRLVLEALAALRLVERRDDSGALSVNNLTLINLFLIKLGPTAEARLAGYLLAFQLACSCLAFAVRYPLAAYFYDP